MLSAYYVENYVCAGVDRCAFINQGERHKSIHEDRNLLIHECSHGSTDLDFCGLHFDGVALEVRMSWKRLGVFVLRSSLFCVFASVRGNSSDASWGT